MEIRTRHRKRLHVVQTEMARREETEGWGVWSVLNEGSDEQFVGEELE